MMTLPQLILAVQKTTNSTKTDVCYWTLCTANQAKTDFTGCYKYGSGTRADLARAAIKLPWKASKLFIAECVKPGESTSLGWSRNLEGFPIIEDEVKIE